MPYSHLTPFERGQIHALRNEGCSNAHIARKLQRHPATIGRELRRNGRQNGYNPAKAQQRYKERRMACRPARKLEYSLLWTTLIDSVLKRWTPQLIAGRLPLDFPDDPRMRISHEAIYQAIYSDPRLHFLIEFLPQARPRRRKHGQGKTRRAPSIPNRVGIEERPAIIDERGRFGDWEGDLIVGAGQSGYILTLTERKSRLLLARKLTTKDAQVVSDAVIDALYDVPQSWIKTITFDNGTEFAAHERITKALNVRIFFADPYASYQRGTNENTNGLIRRYLPKNESFEKLDEKALERITKEINERPKALLEFRTPNETFNAECQKRRIALNA